jgi:hypothetical protein
VVSGEVDVFVLRLLESLEGFLFDWFLGRCSGRTMLKVITFLNEMLPALCSSMRVLYTNLGLLPVGRPSTKGFSDVEACVLMRSTDVSWASVFRRNT